MKTIPFAFIFMLFTQATFSQSHFEQAMDWRTEGAVGHKADAKPISNAIEYFQKTMSEPENELKAGVYLNRSYIFKGRFVYDKAEEKREVFEKAKVIGHNSFRSIRTIKNCVSKTLRPWALGRNDRNIQSCQRRYCRPCKRRDRNTDSTG